MLYEVESAQKFLQEEFSRRVRLNHRYSLRAFARTLGFSSGALSEILRNRRPISLKVAAKIASSLGLNAVETRKFFQLIQDEKQNNFDQVASEPQTRINQVQKKLDEDTFHLVSEWQHFAILNLMDCEGFRWNSTYIAKRLGLGQTQAQLAMNLLFRLGLVRKNGNTVGAVQDFVLAPTGISSASIQKYHRQMMTKAVEAIDLQSLNERDITGIGFAVDQDRLPQMKKEISEFQDQLVTKYSKGKKHEVYFLEMALFKLTKGDRNEKN